MDSILNFVLVGDLITALPILIEKTSLLWLPRLPTDCIFLAHELIVLVALLVLTYHACWGDLSSWSPNWQGLHSIQNLTPTLLWSHVCVCLFKVAWDKVCWARNQENSQGKPFDWELAAFFKNMVCCVY